jgi:hypothetical protein
MGWTTGDDRIRNMMTASTATTSARNALWIPLDKLHLLAVAARLQSHE